MASIKVEAVKAALPKKYFKELQEQFHNLRDKPIATYQWTRRKTDYPDAQADVSVFDETGKHIIEGREFSGGRAFFWLAPSS